MGDYIAKYDHVWASLIDDFQFKVTISTIFTFAVTIVEVMTELLMTDVMLVAGLVGLITLDTISGIMKVVLTKGWGGLSSFGFWNVGIKIIEYFIILTAFTLLSNMNSSLGWVQLWSFSFVGVREVWSIGENMTSIKVLELINAFKDVLKSKNKEIS